MKYIIHCLLSKDFNKYHHKLVDEIAKKYGLLMTKEENLAAHFTLKYWFETNKVEEVEESIAKFCKTHGRAPVRAGGFGGFPTSTVFVNVKLSAKAKKIFSEFIFKLRTIKWMPWDRYDAENLHFHSTIAEECNKQYNDVLNFVNGKEKSFDCEFDNITILKQVSVKQGVGTWKVHKKFKLR